jgi:hypothetical protein
MLLSFYPAELRAEFGAEMTEVFLEDLEDSRRCRGMVGIVRVWWRSMRELCRIASPEIASRREIAVPVLIYLLQVIDLGVTVFLPQHNRSALPVKDAFVLIFGISLVPAFVARIAQRIGDNSVPMSLNLEQPSL